MKTIENQAIINPDRKPMPDPAGTCDYTGNQRAAAPQAGGVTDSACLITAYIQRLRIRNRSQLTFDHYQSLLSRFNQHLLALRAGDLCAGDASGITRQSLESFYQSLLTSACVSTRNNYVSILNGFCSFLYANGYMEKDLSQTLSHVKERYSDTPPEDMHENYYPPEVLEMLYNHLLVNMTKMNLRNLSLIALMLGTGLRISEVCVLCVTNFTEMEKGAVKCRRKGGAWATVPVPAYAVAHLRRYLDTRVTKGSDPLFISTHGNRLTRVAA
jgi:site-specific recombinase XerD